MVYIGIYSPRPGTIGAKKYEDNVPKTIKKQRWDKLNNWLRKTSLENNQQEIGNIKDVMISRKLKTGQYFGYTDNMKNIIIDAPAQGISIGDFAQVKIN